MSIVDLVQQHLGPNEVNQLSAKLGIEPSVAQNAISTVLPAILGGIASHASTTTGADAVKRAIESHQTVTDNVGALIQAGPPADTSGLLSKIFGAHGATVQQGVQRTTGLDPEEATKLLAIVSPIVLGVIARKHFAGQTAGQIDTNALSRALGEATSAAAAANSGGVSELIGKIFGATQTPPA
jgi:hypothetical protein